MPQSYLIHEQMIVTDRIENVDQLGFFIYRLCRGKETYKLQRKEAMKGKCSSCNLLCWQKVQCRSSSINRLDCVERNNSY